MTFYVGQKVVCVAPEDDLVRGRIYTVMACGSDYYGVLMADVDQSKFDSLAFFAWRFRPIIEKKTDISIFTAMLTPKKRGVDA